MSNRQTTIKKLVDTYRATAEFGTPEQFEAAQRAIADYVAKNIDRITIASDAKKTPAA